MINEDWKDEKTSGNGDKPPNWQQYDQRRFNMKNLHQKPTSIFKLCNQSIATPGNLIVIYAQPKAGKSAVVSAMIATIISDDELGDFLGFAAAANLSQFAVLHFDTEQSPYDHEQIVLRAMRRAGLEDPPSWLRSYCLTDLDIHARRAFIALELERASKECSGVFALLIDGVADFVTDVNDIAETHNFVVELHGLAINHNCVLILVLHENPSSRKDIEKMRGHLGSQLERKAESNIRIVKEKKAGVMCIYTEKSRHANIPAKDGHRFKWDEKSQTHLSCDDQDTDHSAEDLPDLVEQIFDCQAAHDHAGGLTWKEIHHRIKDLLEYKSLSAARRKFAAIIKAKLIEKSPASRPTRYWPANQKNERYA